MDLGLALCTLGQDLRVPHIHAGVLHLLHRACDGLGIGHVVHRGHRQQRDLLLHIEHVPDHQSVDIDARIQRLQVADRHVVGIGDGVEGVSLHHRVGGVASGVGHQGGLELLGGHLPLLRVDILHLDVIHKFSGDGVLIHILALQLVQHGLQGSHLLHGAHRHAVDADLIAAQAIGYLAELLQEVVLHLVGLGQLRPQGKGEIITDLPLHLVVVSQDLRASALHLSHRVGYHSLVTHHTQSIPVHRDSVGRGV